jgi:hypothetical protein
MEAEHGRLAAVAASAGTLVTAALTVPYLIGGLETTVGTVNSRVWDDTHDKLLVAAAGTATSATIETALTLAVGGCMAAAPHVARVFERRQYESGEAPQRQPGVWGAIKHGAAVTGTTLAAGSPGIMLRSFVRTPDPEGKVWGHMRKGFYTVGALAAVHFPLGYGQAGALEASPNVVVEYAQKPWAVFLGITAGFAVYSGAKSGLKAGVRMVRNVRGSRGRHRIDNDNKDQLRPTTRV